MLRTEAYTLRMIEVFNAITRDAPGTRLHALRGLQLAGGPSLADRADSTDAGRNWSQTPHRLGSLSGSLGSSRKSNGDHLGFTHNNRGNLSARSGKPGYFDLPQRSTDGQRHLTSARIIGTLGQVFYRVLINGVDSGRVFGDIARLEFAAGKDTMDRRRNHRSSPQSCLPVTRRGQARRRLLTIAERPH